MNVSFVLIFNVLHEIFNKEWFLKKARRILKPSGRIAIIDWEKKQIEMGLPINHRLDKQETMEFLKSSGFVVNLELEIADVFYGIIAAK